MTDTTEPPVRDRRPVIAIVPWDSGFRAWDPIDSTSGEPWQPRGARIETLSSEDPGALADLLIQHLSTYALSSVLLVGRSIDSGTIHLQTRAENRVPGTKRRDDPVAAGVVRATLPTADILRDLEDEGLSARALSDEEDDAGSYLLYRILSHLPDTLSAPPIGLLRLPRDMPPAQVNRAMRITATAVARHLPPLPV